MRKEYGYPTAFSSWDDAEKSAIDRVLSSGRLTMGGEVAAFEAEFAAHHGMRYGVMVNSGSSANLVAVAALFHLDDRQPLKRNDKVIVPAIAWSTTYAPLIQYGLEPLVSDCDDTWNADDDFGLFNVRLVVGCSVLGNPAHLAEWKEFAGIRGAHFIEDNCESLGATTFDGKQCGTFGLMNTFSFFYSHQISAVEGGMILTDDAECYTLCRMLRAHGWTRDVVSPETFEDEYDFQVFGYNVRPLEMHAAIGREQLKKIDRLNAARQANAAYFRKLTADLPLVHPRPNGVMNPFGLAFTVKETQIRTRVVAALRARDIDCRLPTGGNFLRHGYGQSWKYEQRAPYADFIHFNGLFIGCAPFDISDRIDQAVEAIKGAL